MFFTKGGFPLKFNYNKLSDSREERATPSFNEVKHAWKENLLACPLTAPLSLDKSPSSKKFSARDKKKKKH
jgi:hypothetical protein